MKLYVVTKDGKAGKVFLRTTAPTRQLLAQQIGGPRFQINGINYFVNEVCAEKGADNTSIGLVVGGIIGSLGGGPGVAAGGVIGAMLGKETDRKEEAAVAAFNRSSV